MQFDKKSQLFKVKKDNPKKMSKGEYKKKCDWLFDKYPRCQICLSQRATQAHHAIFGKGDRDDRSIIAICPSCHHEIHHGKGVSISRDCIEAIGIRNHEEWLNEI